MYQNKFEVKFSSSKSFLSTVNKVFDKYGVVLIKDFLTDKKNKKNISSSEVFFTALYFYRQIANKISIRTRISNDLKELDFYVKSLEKIDYLAGLEVQKLISKSVGMMNFSNNDEINNIASSLLNVKKNNILLESCGNFTPNIPSNSSRLFTWHSENHWLPYRRKFITCWVPLFRRKKKNNGTMAVKPFSHKERHLFYEYQGYENSKSVNKKSVIAKRELFHYEVLENKKFDTVFIDAEDGDVVFFDQNLLHRSEFNSGKKTTYLYNNRFFNTEKDLTISSNLNLRPYSSESAKIGRKLNIKKKY